MTVTTIQAQDLQVTDIVASPNYGTYVVTSLEVTDTVRITMTNQRLKRPTVFVTGLDSLIEVAR